jgi:PAS domain S-box-containing protein
MCPDLPSFPEPAALGNERQPSAPDSADLLRTAQEAAHLGLYRWNIETGGIYCDAFVRRIWGWDEHQPITYDMFLANLDPDDRARVEEAIGRAVDRRRRDVYEIEYRIRRSDDGARRWIAATGRATFVDDRAAEFTGTIIDITIRKQTELALFESEERYRSLVNATSAIVWIADPYGAFMQPQPAWQAYTGQEFAAYRSWGWLNALHEDDRAPIAAEWLRALDERSTYRSGGRIWHAASQRYRWFEVQAAPVFTAGGAVREWMGTITDIDDQRRTEIELQSTEARLALALEAAELGAWDIDLRSGRGLWSDALFRMLGHDPTPGNIVDRSLWDQTVYPDDVPAVREAARRAATDGSLFRPVHRIIRADTGEITWVQPAGRLVMDQTGHPIRFIGVLADITDRKRSEEHLRMLLDELNHRVKNSLSTIQSMVRQTLLDGADIREAREWLESRLLTLAGAHDLLTRQGWSATGLEEIVRLSLAPFAAGAAFDQRFRLAGPITPITSRTALSLTMALHELATNAAKYGALSSPEGRVSLTWTRDETSLTIDWTESGGPPVKPPERRGFGTRLLERGLARDLNGTVALDFAPQGVHCRMTMPVQTPSPP